jgi:hypothetical protein
LPFAIENRARFSIGLGFERLLAANTDLDRLGLGVGKIPSGSTAPGLRFLLRAVEEETIFR